jgi:hypothetical protein
MAVGYRNIKKRNRETDGDVVIKRLDRNQLGMRDGERIENL